MLGSEIGGWQARRERDYRSLRVRLATAESLRRLAWLSHEAHLEPAPMSWPAAAEQLGTPVPDSALLPILIDAHKTEAAAWNEALLLLFWPSLVHIHCKKRRWADCPHELWDDILASFAIATHRLDPTQRRSRLAYKVFGDTIRATYRTREKDWATTAREIARPPDHETWCTVEDPTSSVEEHADHRCDREFRRRHYLRLLDKRAITADEYLVLSGVRLCGWTVRTCADRLGISYEAAKKRLQRVERKIISVDPLNCVPHRGGSWPLGEGGRSPQPEGAL